MRVLLPVPQPAGIPGIGGGNDSGVQAHDEADVHGHYAEGWIGAGGMRVDFVASVDGAAHANGRSAGLQTPGDNRIFAALRDLADVVLVGAGTAVAEGYGPVRVSERRAAVRRRFGLAPVLPVAVSSRSLRLDPGAGLFTDAAPGARTIVLTCASAPGDRRSALAEVADVVECGDDTVDPARALTALRDRGHVHVLAEGGPTVFADQVTAGVVDELCLTISPSLIGPGPGRIASGAGWPRSHPLILTGLLEENGALFARYRVGPADTSGDGADVR